MKRRPLRLRVFELMASEESRRHVGERLLYRLSADLEFLPAVNLDVVIHHVIEEEMNERKDSV